MTLLGILADIHGNLPALMAVEDDLKQYGVDQVIVLGDLINWGPFSCEVVEHILKKNWSVIRGNNEYYLIDGNTRRAPIHWSNYTVLPWLRDQLDGRLRNIISSWPDTLSLRYPDGHPIQAYHGIPNDNSDTVLPSMSKVQIKRKLKCIEESTVLLAHSHIAMSLKIDKWNIINPGSVGGPINGIPEASYVLLEAKSYDYWESTFLKIPYDITSILEEFNKQHFIEKVGLIGQLIIKEFETSRLHVIPFQRWRSEKYPNKPISLEMLSMFTDDLRWQYTPPEYRLP
jgi:protein phosphatase